MKATFWLQSVAALCVLLAACGDQGRSPVSQQSSDQIVLDGDDIGGVVSSANGPEAGVWVIAETDVFDTFYAKIVVTDDQGRYVVPDLPDADYKVWVRGYGLADSMPVVAKPGAHVDLTANVAPDAATAAKVYPAAYWYAMLHLPKADEVAKVPGGMNGYLMWIKNMGCVGCHQLGNKATRTLEPALGQFDNSVDAWQRRIQSGQAGGTMVQTHGRHSAEYPAEISGRLDGPNRGRRNAVSYSRAPDRTGARRRRHGARLGERVDLSARSFRHRPARSDRERLWKALWLAGVQHRRLPDSRSEDEYGDDVPCAGS